MVRLTQEDGVGVDILPGGARLPRAEYPFLLNTHPPYPSLYVLITSMYV